MTDHTTATDSPSDHATDRRTDRTTELASQSRSLRWGSALLALSGLGVVGNGLAMLYRALYSAGFEAGVPTLDGLTHAELAAEYHELAHYVDHLHVNVAGLLVALGVGLVALSWFGVRRGERWALGTAVAMPALFLAHSLPIHQTAAFGFDAVVHLGPGLLWLPALVGGAALAYRGLDSGETRADPATEP